MASRSIPNRKLVVLWLVPGLGFAFFSLLFLFSIFDLCILTALGGKRLSNDSPTLGDFQQSNLPREIGSMNATWNHFHAGLYLSLYFVKCSDDPHESTFMLAVPSLPLFICQFIESLKLFVCKPLG